MQSPATAKLPPALVARIATLLLFGLFILVGTVLTANAFFVAKDAYQTLEAGSPTNVDFPQLYAGARTIISSPTQVYDESWMLRSVLSVHGLGDIDPSLTPQQELTGVLQYYNPPFFLLLLSPLTLLEPHVAYALTIVFNVLALGGLLILAGVVLRWRQPMTLLIVAAVSAFIPVHVTLYNSEPNILIALLLMAAFLAMEARRGALASTLLVLTAAKPQWLVLPGLSFLRNSPRGFLPLALVSVLLILGPFLVLGVGALQDYVGLLTGRADANLEQESYSASLFNWLGFFRALTGSVQPAATLLMSAVTLAVFAFVMMRGDRYLTWAAAILTTLIVLPHGHAHEWVVAFPAAVFLLRRPMLSVTKRATVALLLTGHLAVTTSVFAQGIVRDGGQAVYWMIPLAFGIVVWCAVLPSLEEGLRQRGGLAFPGDKLRTAGQVGS